MPWFEQRKPRKTTGLDKGEKLIRVSVDLTPAELELLDSLVAVTGLSTRTRCIRWLMRAWQAVVTKSQVEPPWDGSEVKLALFKDGKVRQVDLPSGWVERVVTPEVKATVAIHKAKKSRAGVL